MFLVMGMRRETQISSKVDTGAEVTLMSESAWQKLKNTFQLNRPPTLKCHRNSTFPYQTNGNESTRPVFIIHNLRNNLLGRSAIKLLKIIPLQLDTIRKNIPDEPVHRFRHHERTIHHHIKAWCKTFALYTPRSIPERCSPSRVSKDGANGSYFKS